MQSNLYFVLIEFLHTQNLPKLKRSAEIYYLAQTFQKKPSRQTRLETVTSTTLYRLNVKVFEILCRVPISKGVCRLITPTTSV